MSSVPGEKYFWPTRDTTPSENTMLTLGFWPICDHKFRVLKWHIEWPVGFGSKPMIEQAITADEADVVLDITPHGEPPLVTFWRLLGWEPSAQRKGKEWNVRGFTRGRTFMWVADAQAQYEAAQEWARAGRKDLSTNNHKQENQQ
jgi:hypothetical protein